MGADRRGKGRWGGLGVGGKEQSSRLNMEYIIVTRSSISTLNHKPRLLREPQRKIISQGLLIDPWREKATGLGNISTRVGTVR